MEEKQITIQYDDIIEYYKNKVSDLTYELAIKDAYIKTYQKTIDILTQKNNATVGDNNE